MRFRFVAAERARHKVSRLCAVIGVTRQGFYAWLSRLPSARLIQDQKLKALARLAGGPYPVDRRPRVAV